MSTDSIRFFRLPHFSLLPGVAHATTERTGDVSRGPFASLNLSLGVGDGAAAVLENRRRTAAALGQPLQRWVVAEQVHGARVSVVGTNDVGRGTIDQASRVPHCDALVSNARGVVLVTLSADCVPLLFYDPAHRAIGAAHAGWRGTVANVAAATVDVMRRAFGTRPAELQVGIGPSIGPDDYEVREDVARQLPGAARNGKLDLWLANRTQLVAAGILDEHIEVATVSTYAHPERFFSHRRQTQRTPRSTGGIGGTALWLT